MNDVRICLRSLAKRPGFSAAAIAVLALAIGANTALFSIVHSVLFQSPADEPDRLLVMWQQDVERERPLIEVSYSNFADWREQSRTFEDMAAFGSVNWGHVLTISAEPHRVSSAAVSWSFFETLGVRPLLGRAFRPEDDEIGAAQVAVLSYGLWQNHFGRDSHIVGKTIQLEGDTDGPDLFTVVGVMPRDFEFPRGAELWTPVRPRIAAAVRNFGGQVDEMLRRLGVLFVVGRLRKGVAVSAAEAELNVLLNRLGRRYGWPPGTIVQTPFMDFYLGGNTRSSLAIVWGAVGLVLFIACANVAGLLLVRAVANRRELAIRRALGADRLRILRPVVLEGVVLALSGGALGIALAAAGLRLLTAAAPVDVPGVAGAELNGTVLGVTMGLCLAAGLLSAMVPAWHASSLASVFWLRAGYRPAGQESGWAHSGLVVFEVALALALLVGGGLTGRSLWNLYATDLGYEPGNVLTFKVPFLESRYPTTADKHAFSERVLERIDALPGVVTAGAVYLRPLEHGPVGMDGSFIAEGQPFEPVTAEQNPMLNWQAATPGYFATMEIRLLEGRVFDRTDSKEAHPVGIVSEGLAWRMWPGESAIGKRLWVTGDDEADEEGPGNPRWRTVIGVVEDARYRELTRARFDFYVPFRQSRSPVRHFVIRTVGDPLELVPAVREQVHAIDGSQPLDGITTLGALVEKTRAPWRFTAVVLAAFGGVALVLAVSGLFSVLAYTVSRKIPEIGVRMALGATEREVLHLFVQRGLILTAIGVAGGLILALGLTRTLSGLLYEIEPTDPLTYAGVTVLLLAVCLVGSYVPARRAARVDPNEALRCE